MFEIGLFNILNVIVKNIIGILLGFFFEVCQESSISIVIFIPVFFRFFLGSVLYGNDGSGIHNILGIKILVFDRFHFNENRISGNGIQNRKVIHITFGNLGFGEIGIGHIRFEIRVGRVVFVFLSGNAVKIDVFRIHFGLFALVILKNDFVFGRKRIIKFICAGLRSD